MAKKILIGCFSVILIPIIIGVVLNIIMAINVNVRTAKMQNTLKVGGLISEFKPATSTIVFVEFKKQDDSMTCLALMPRRNNNCSVSTYEKEGEREKVKDIKEIPDFEYNKFITDNWALVRDCDEMSVMAIQFFYSSRFSVLYSSDGKVTAIKKREFSGG